MNSVFWTKVRVALVLLVLAQAPLPGQISGPSVIVTPNGDFSVPAGSHRAISVTAFANSGRTIKRVDLFQNGVLLQQDSTAQNVFSSNTFYQGSFDFIYQAPVTQGNYALQLVAVDSNDVTVAESVALEVTAPYSAPPFVSLESPAAGTTVAAGRFLTISALASDLENSIQSVAFYADGALIQAIASVPYNVNYFPTAAGSLTLTAIATDNSGQTSVATRTISVGGQPQGTPAVRLTSPHPGTATVVAGQRIIFEAIAQPGTEDTFINTVSFLANGSTIGAAGRQVGFSSLYRVDDIVFSQPGTYVVTALVSDSRDVFAQSENSQTVTVIAPPTASPSIALVSPAVAAGATGVVTTTLSALNLIAVATDFAGIVNEVEFFVDRGGRATGTAQTTVERNNAGVITRAFVSGLTVTNPGEGYLVLPRIVFGGTGTGASARVNSLTAARGVGSVEILSGGVGYENANIRFAGGGLYEAQSLGRATVGLDGITWSLPFNPGQLGEGPYFVYAVARKADGTQGESLRRRIDVIGATSRPPTVVIQASASAQVGVSTLITAQAVDPDGTVTQLEYFANGVSLGVATTAPFQFNWIPPSAGSYGISAIATDNSGNSTRSAPRIIAVAGNRSPVATLTNPLSGSLVATSAITTLRADATDSDGTVAKVEFFANGVSISSDTAAPFTADWNPSLPGDYTLTVVAVDNAGAVSSASSPVQVFAAFEVRGSPLTDSTEFVNATFSDLLARQPSATERTQLVTALNNGTLTRAGLIAQLSDSVEFKRVYQAALAYKLALGTWPTTAELFAALTNASSVGGGPGGGTEAGATRATALTVTSAQTEAGIETFGDVDYYRFTVAGAATTVTVSSSGSADIVGRLENADGTILATNDDGAGFPNFQMTALLAPGTYFVRVAGFSVFTLGNYTLNITGVELGTSSGGTTNPVNADLSAVVNGLLSSTAYRNRYGALVDMTNEVNRRAFFRQVFGNAYGSVPSALQETQGQFGISLVGAPGFLAAMIDGTRVNGLNGGISGVSDLTPQGRAVALIATLAKQLATDVSIAPLVGQSSSAAAATVLASTAYRNRFITIATAPLSQTARVGATLRLSVDAAGAQPMEYRWYKNAREISGANSQFLEISPVALTDAGYYTVQLSNAVTSVYAPTAFVSVGVADSKLSALSTRAVAGSGASVIIAGFAISGDQPKQILVRGGGPALINLGVAGALADPKIDLYQGQKLLFSNNDWSTDNALEKAASSAKVGAFTYDNGSKDAALLASVEPGNYTVHVSGSGTSGISLVEVYDLNNAGSGSRPVALSTRAEVKPGADNIIIGGFSITGTSSRRVLLRGIGPGLTTLNVPGALSNPKLTLFNNAGLVIAQNDNWEQGNDVSTVTAASQQAGAFGLQAGSKDAVLITTLSPGNYTAHVTSADGSSGIALVEIYDLER